MHEIKALIGAPNSRRAGTLLVEVTGGVMTSAEWGYKLRVYGATTLCGWGTLDGPAHRVQGDDAAWDVLVPDAELARIGAIVAYRIVEHPSDHSTVGQDCGVHSYADLPERIRRIVDASPDAGEWTLPSLSDGDRGEELPDLCVTVSRVRIDAGGDDIDA